MAFATSPGHPSYTGNFIPEIWSGKLIENFYDATVLAAISNTSYEGEIKNMGDTVNIRTTPELTIQTYVKGQTLSVENPDKAKLQLIIDKGEYFAAVEDDVDQVQSDVNMMDMWSKDASERMKIKIDTRVLTDMLTDVSSSNKGQTAGRISGNIDLGVAGTPEALISIIAPHEEPDFLTANKYFSQDLTDFLSGQKNGFFLISEFFQLSLSQDIKPSCVTAPIILNFGPNNFLSIIFATAPAATLHAVSLAD